MRDQFADGRRERTTDVVQLSGKPTGGKMSRGIQRYGNDPLERLRFRPFADVTVPRDEAVPEGEPLTNAPYAHPRKIHPLGPQHDSLDQFELGILHKHDPGNREQRAINLHSIPTFARQNYINTSPLNIVNPATYNYLIALQQKRLQGNADTLREYVQLRPQDLWCRDWSMDGVVEHANPLGYPGEGDTSNTTGQKKMATMIVHNGVYCYNYWARSGLMVPGSVLCAVLKKFDVTGPDGQIRYWLNHGYGTGGQLSGNGGAGATVLMANAQPGATDGTTMPFKPFQLGFFVLPYGGAVPREVVMYEDEYGTMHYDGLVIRIGRVQFTPREQQAHVLHPAYSQPINVLQSVEAWVDSNVGVGGNLTQLKLMVDCDDGATPL